MTAQTIENATGSVFATPAHPSRKDAWRDVRALAGERDMLPGLRAAFAPSPLEILDRHIARDIGIEFETYCVNLLRQGGI